MIDIDTFDQLERLKVYWRAYRAFIIINFVLIILSGFGWYYWQQYRENSLIAASVQYEALLNALLQRDAINIELQADQLIKQYPRTIYAQLAALQLAKQYVYQRVWAKAENRLLWVIHTADNQDLRAVARIRLARILAAEHREQEAITLLNKNDNNAYIPAVEITKGDVFVSLNKKREALHAYQIAQSIFPDIEIMQPLLQMKINDLGGSFNKNMTGIVMTVSNQTD